jgi:catechol 2,3-dioxygenase-like lactoylglutathione lyase family enzyme
LRITVTSVFVHDQDEALAFLHGGPRLSEEDRDPPGGGEVADRRLARSASPEAPDGVELLLEPNSNPAAKTYQKAIFDQGIPATTFAVDDIEREYERLTGRGVRFTMKPTKAGPATLAVFDDTCGNLIQLHQA